MSFKVYQVPSHPQHAWEFQDCLLFLEKNLKLKDLNSNSQKLENHSSLPYKAYVHTDSAQFFFFFKSV